MKNITKALLLTIVGFNFALVADNVHAQTVDQMKVCKAIGLVSDAASGELVEHYKALLSLNGVSGIKQDEFKGIAEGLYNGDLNMYMQALHNCLIEKGGKRVGKKVKR